MQYNFPSSAPVSFLFHGLAISMQGPLNVTLPLPPHGPDVPHQAYLAQSNLFQILEIAHVKGQVASALAITNNSCIKRDVCDY